MHGYRLCIWRVSLLEQLIAWRVLGTDRCARASFVDWRVSLLYLQCVMLLSGCSGCNDNSAAAQQLEHLVAWRVRGLKLGVVHGSRLWVVLCHLHVVCHVAEWL